MNNVIYLLIMRVIKNQKNNIYLYLLINNNSDIL